MKKDGFSDKNPERRPFPYVDSFQIMELVSPEISIIGVRLYDHTEQQNAGPQKSSGETLRGDVQEFRISPLQARKLASALIQTADEIEGIGAARQ